MDENSEEPAIAAPIITAPSISQAGVRYKWFPILWVGIPLLISFVIDLMEGDPGVANTIRWVTLLLGLLGITWWLFRCTHWSRKICWFCGALPSALVAAQYAHLTPLEIKTDGAVGIVGYQWRWQTPDRELEQLESQEATELDWQTTPNDYPRFLGNGYWAEVSGVELETDWEANPPKLLWKEKIGAGWSSFAVVGNYAITQEQRGDREYVVCYDIQTFQSVWSHSDPVRWDPGGAGALGYAGPRATPTIYGGKVFVQGATGIFNCLDAKTGNVLWSHDTLKKHGSENVVWGKSCSPLVVDDMVVVSVGGKQNQSVVAYEMATGEVRWASGEYQSSYASPVLAEIGGVRQVVSVDENYVTARRADNGQALWEFSWPSSSGAEAAVSQPIPLSGDRLFVSKGYGVGAALFQITNDEGDHWQLVPLWRKTVLKTKMSNVVIHDGFVYGLDDKILQCVELETGKKKWKKRRVPEFGYGQMMLIGDTILFLSEGGEVILVEAAPEKYRELASLRAFDDDSVTWNNPVFAAPYLLVRNAEEAACYELPINKVGASLAE